mmetsp:Transcript_89137/g.265874  ORF Transcript_89137/g.265874 Transcript_89137/m.265874 type:complete len:202 (-) Transcript_89137:11-616(-)
MPHPRPMLRPVGSPLADVDVQCADGPVSLRELLRVHPDKVLAAQTLNGLVRAAVCKGRVTHVAAEGCVEDQPHLLEVGWIAVPWPYAEVGIRRAPRLGVRRLLQQVGRLGAAGPEPGPDVAGLGVPLGGVGATSRSVERRAHGGLGASLRAPLVGPLVRGRNVAVGGGPPLAPGVPLHCGCGLRDLVLAAILARVQGRYDA